MARSVSQPELDPGLLDVVREAAGGIGSLILRNPLIVGGTTAFLVTLCYVSANAIWYQPSAHGSPLFSTRNFSQYQAPAPDKPVFREDRTRIIIREGTDAAGPTSQLKGDPDLARVQSVLSSLKLYEGTIDGLEGPQTRDAIRRYQRIVGHAVTGEVTPELLDQLVGREVTAAIPRKNISYEPTGAIPTPTPRPDYNIVSDKPPVPLPQQTEQNTVARQTIERVQAGLRSFGNDQIVVDGKQGIQTRDAIKEFQSLFGLPATGHVDEKLVSKMKEIGLIN